MPDSPPFTRPQEGFRFVFGGLNLRDTSDTIGPEKYASAVNVRGTSSTAVKTRPGYSSLFSTGNNNGITDLASYATLGTDASPRILARDAAGTVWLGTGNNASSLTTMSGNNGYGASMLPFRPAQSPQSWMYVSTQGDYQKFSAPDSNNSVTVQKVGLAEPQSQLEAAPQAPQFTDFSSNAAGWTAGGTAGALSDVNLTSDTAVAIFVDPALSTRYSVQVASTVPYLQGETVVFNGAITTEIQDVLPPVAGGSGLTIQAIRYASGTTGRCMIVPSPLPIGQAPDSGQIGQLRRGALVKLNGSEVVLVLDAFAGTNGSVAFECSTAGTFAAGNAIIGIPAIIVDGVNGTVVGNSITSAVIDSTLATGTATLSRALGTNPFAQQLGSSGILPTPDDYVRLLLNIGDPTKITSISLIFNVGTSVDYATEIYFYQLSGTDLVNSDTANLTEIAFQIRSLTRTGGNGNRTLANCNGVRIQVVSTASVAFQYGSLAISGGGQPDIGDSGTFYSYRAVPRSTLTGVKGNASPVMRYGVNPRRQNVAVTLPAAPGQSDIWDIFRYGGTVTTYRYIGSGAPSTTFVDQYFDDTATAGNLLETDNFEPWPSVDSPYKVTSGGGTTITVVGSFITISGPSTWPSTILRWLPGTLIQLGGQAAYTLRARPTALSGTSYLFEVIEAIGTLSPALFTIQEPNAASQPNPYTWGPDANGFFFGTGDSLRPGTISFSKPYAPDAVPDSYNLDLCPPSEPLLGGQTLNTVNLAASSDRWWSLYPAFGGQVPFTQLPAPVGRGLAAPYGIATDKQRIFFWAKDCIAATAGSGYDDLTGRDLYPLFPHEGVAGANVTRSGTVYYAPDYARAATFRLAFLNGYLFADYADSTGTRRTLVLHVTTGAWSADSYANAIRARCAIAQPEAGLTTSTSAYPLLVMADNAGNVYKESDLTNDGTTAIACILATFEWNGGDLRVNENWGDVFLDSKTPAGLTATPVTKGALVATATAVAAATTREFSQVSTGGGTLQNFLGLLLTWTDDYTVQSAATVLYAWQPSFTAQVEITTDRMNDWTNLGADGAKWVQGFVLDADTSNVAKSISFRNGDSGDVEQTFAITHNGRQELAYSFDEPFICHLVRTEPQGSVPWRQFGFRWIWEPTPELASTWKTQVTAHGLVGFHFLYRIEAAYASTAAVTLTIAAIGGGTSPSVLTLPSTSGAYNKPLLTPTFNKGQLFQYSAVSDEPFQIFLNDWVVYVGEWGRQTECIQYKLLGGEYGDKARI